MLERLSISLKENGLPELQDGRGQRRPQRRPAHGRHPGAPPPAIRSRSPGRAAVRLPGNVNLVLDASWLIQETYPDGRTKLLVTKGVVFDEKGQATVVDLRNLRAASTISPTSSPSAGTTATTACRWRRIWTSRSRTPTSSSTRSTTSSRTRLMMAAAGRRRSRDSRAPDAGARAAPQADRSG